MSRGKTVTRAEFDALAVEVKKNTELTADIHAMVRSFKILRAAAQLVAIVVGAAVALKGWWKP